MYHFRRIPEIITHKVISIDKDKDFDQKLSPAVQRIVLEMEWTDYLQNLVDLGDKQILRNFSLRLEMDDSDDVPEARQIVYHEKEVNP